VLDALPQFREIILMSGRTEEMMVADLMDTKPHLGLYVILCPMRTFRCPT
jgi:hypothetical protein